MKAAVPRPPDRMERLGRPLRRKPEGGPSELTARHKLLVEYQLHGCMKPELLTRITRPTPVIEDGVPVIRELSPKPGEPLTLIEAADLLRVRRRNARELVGLKVYRDYFEAELEKYRNGERAASVRTIVQMRDEAGDGKAADRKVRLEASRALLGADFTERPTVNVNVQNNTRITAGIVVQRYRPEPHTIEHLQQEEQQ